MIMDSPLSVDGTNWGNEDNVMEFLIARILMTEEEWNAEPEHEWDISREEAAQRVDDEDWSPPDWFQGPQSG